MTTDHSGPAEAAPLGELDRKGGRQLTDVFVDKGLLAEARRQVGDIPDQPTSMEQAVVDRGEEV
jgi:hypothetical protein